MNDLNYSHVKPIDLEKLNPGIRATVRFLREHGFETCDSGDGVTHEFECDLPHPYVHIRCDPSKLASETQRLIVLMKQSGVKFDPQPYQNQEGDAWKHLPTVEASYMPLGHPDGFIHLFSVVLTEEGSAA
jgi:hypothetical protein